MVVVWNSGCDLTSAGQPSTPHPIPVLHPHRGVGGATSPQWVNPISGQSPEQRSQYKEGPSLVWDPCALGNSVRCVQISYFATCRNAVLFSFVETPVELVTVFTNSQRTLTSDVNEYVLFKANGQISRVLQRSPREQLSVRHILRTAAFMVAWWKVLWGLM